MHLTNVYCYVPKYLEGKWLVFQREGGNSKVRVGMFSKVSPIKKLKQIFSSMDLKCVETWLTNLTRLISYLMLISKQESVHFNIKHTKDILKTF